MKAGGDKMKPGNGPCMVEYKARPPCTLGFIWNNNLDIV